MPTATPKTDGQRDLAIIHTVMVVTEPQGLSCSLGDFKASHEFDQKHFCSLIPCLTVLCLSLVTPLLSRHTLGLHPFTLSSPFSLPTLSISLFTFLSLSSSLSNPVFLYHPVHMTSWPRLLIFVAHHVEWS